MGRRGLRTGTMGGVIGAAMMLALVSCGSGDGYGRQPVMTGDGGTQAQTDELRRRRPPMPSQPPPATSPGGAAPGGGSNGGTTTEQVIMAAQTPDGQAIPQPAGPDGACPPVVQALGFWSCPTIGETCSFASGGATRHCTCSRTEGEGAFPSWICD